MHLHCHKWWNWLLPVTCIHRVPKHSVGPCNGNLALCDRQYSEVSQIGTHGSPFDGTYSPFDNQGTSTIGQLEQGVRFLQAQTHMYMGELHLCHTSCLGKDAGTLEAWLSMLKGWMDGHPMEVVSLLLTNGGYVDIEEFDPAFKNSGIKDLVFVPSVTPGVLKMDEWPTFQQLIDNQMRLIAFVGLFPPHSYYLQPSTASNPKSNSSADYRANVGTTLYLLDEFAYFFETPYDTTDPSFGECALDRPPGSSPDGKMYIVNHFLDYKVISDNLLVPNRWADDRWADDRTNSATGRGSIGAQVARCHGKYGRNPKVVLVDWADSGNVVEAQNRMNGV
ncbi:hypothetical protein MMC12_000894 [Toensbergia leucococca]|nr:hypothetical protein [Toensbergia leucococca]